MATSHTAGSPSSISKRGQSAGEHAPGPWSLKFHTWNYGDGERHSLDGVIDVNGNKICLRGVSLAVGGESTGDVTMANTRLTAAAPELLEALRIAEPLIQFLYARNPNNAHYIAALVDISAAIEKATGTAEG